MAIEPIAAISSQVGVDMASAMTSGADKASFQNFLSNEVSSVNAKVVDADNAVRELAMGKAENLHEVMISLEEAKISFELMVQVRNRLVEAYQEVLRMRI